MTVTLHCDPVPVRLDETGTIRVANTRISLDLLLADHQRGLTPEEIVRQLDTLSLADVHGALAYYYRHRQEMDAYLQQREQLAGDMRRLVETNPRPHPTRQELAARLAQRNGGHGSSAD